MKTIEEYLERNIQVLKEQADRDKVFGPSYVQRLCKIGYNQALGTIELAIKQGLLKQDIKCEWKYRFTL